MSWLLALIVIAAEPPESDDDLPQYAEARAVKLAVPVYPRKAVVKGLEGEVYTCFTVTAKGTVRRPRIMRSSDRVFEKPSKRAALKSSFRPARREGKPVDSRFCRTYHFTLDDFGI